MTLAEAIKHLEESLADQSHNWGCEECKAEHEQLLEWLKDYQRLTEGLNEFLIERAIEPSIIRASTEKILKELKEYTERR